MPGGFLDVIAATDAVTQRCEVKRKVYRCPNVLRGLDLVPGAIFGTAPVPELGLVPVPMNGSGSGIFYSTLESSNLKSEERNIKGKAYNAPDNRTELYLMRTGITPSKRLLSSAVLSIETFIV
jgi:hypothetical protein